MDIKAIVRNYYRLFKRKFQAWLSPIRRHFLYYKYWPHLFKKYSRDPIDENKIVLAYSSSYKQIPDNLAAVKASLEAKGYNCVVIDKHEGTKLHKNWVINEFKKFFCCKEFFAEYATAKALFLIDYYFPAFACQPREGQKVVQLWHGCGAFKKWGYSTAEKKWGVSKKDLDRFPIHNTYTHICVSSPKVKFAYAEAFGCGEENILPIGAPRTDVYFDKDFVASQREKLLEQFPGIGNRKIILYAPTFRGNSIVKSYMKNMLDVDLLREKFGEDYALVIKQHPLTAKAFKIRGEEDFVFDATHGVAIETALCAADLVITDYSSLIFEYALLERPMMFFAYDLEKYENDRSFYFDYETFVPGEIVTDTDQIIAEIKRLETDFDVERVRKFRDDFMCACDGNSTERIISTVLGTKAADPAPEKETANV